MASIEIEQGIEESNASHEQTITDILEAEEQIHLWEKRLQLAKEVKEHFDPSTGEGEIKMMEQEINRMRLHLEQINKQKQSLIVQMEQVVDRRGAMVKKNQAVRMKQATQVKAQQSPTTVNAVQRENIKLKTKMKGLIPPALLMWLSVATCCPHVSSLN